MENLSPSVSDKTPQKVEAVANLNEVQMKLMSHFCGDDETCFVEWAEKYGEPLRDYFNIHASEVERDEMRKADLSKTTFDSVVGYLQKRTLH